MESRPLSAGVDVGGTKVWFVVLGGAMAWLAHLLLAYGLAEFGCVAGWTRYAWLDVSVVAWLLTAVSLVMLIVAASAAWLGWQCVRRMRQEEGGFTREAVFWLLRAGFIMSLTFTVVIAVQSVPIIFYLSRC